MALRRRAKTATMAVADFSLRRAGKVLAQGPASPFQTQGEISQGKARDFRSTYPPHIRPLGPECLRASGTFAPSPTSRSPRMRFVSLGPELCLQLPSRVSSRSYGCCSARGSRHSGPPGDLHPQVTSRSAFTSRFSAPVTALRAMPGAQTKTALPTHCRESRFEMGLGRLELPTSRLSGPYQTGQIPAFCRTFTGRTHDLP